MRCSHKNCRLEIYYDSNCILHSKNKDKDITKFWVQIQNDLSKKYKCIKGNEEVDSYEVTYNKVIFPKFQKDYEISDEPTIETSNFYFNHYYIVPDGYCSEGNENYEFTDKLIEKCHIEFNHCTFLDEVQLQRYNFQKLVSFNDCTFEKQVHLNSTIDTKIEFIDCKFSDQEFDLSNKIFNENFVFINCENIKTLNLKNTYFINSVSFSQSKLQNIILDETYFKGICIFVKTHFLENVKFDYCTFEENVFFNDARIYKTIDIEHAIFKKEVTFLDILNNKEKNLNYKNIANRETARIIKHSFEKQNNIIEANKYYALEIKKREKEISFYNNPEWIILFLHKVTSRNSQSWVISLIWIIIISILGIENNIIDSLFKFYYADNYLDLIANSFYKILKFNQNEITFHDLLIKVFMGYLIYQFIISIRQNTRRK